MWVTHTSGTPYLHGKRLSRHLLEHLINSQPNITKVITRGVHWRHFFNSIWIAIWLRRFSIRFNFWKVFIDITQTVNKNNTVIKVSFALYSKVTSKSKHNVILMRAGRIEMHRFFNCRFNTLNWWGKIDFNSDFAKIAQL